MRYLLESKTHGSGGFGKIIKGHDNDLDRDIAVKVLSDLKSALPPEDVDRFRREARILAKLSHPNIPAIYDVVFDDAEQNFLIIFQFVAGQNLRQLLASEGLCGLQEIRLWFHQIASALESAHSIGVIHRDIKPENIIITPDRETAYLVDFGIALTAEDSKKLTEYGYAIGTPGYMSPEQVAGKELDRRTDIYSLGVTIYESLAGHAISVGDYEELSTINEAIPPQIDELIKECLFPVERRIPSAKDFSIRLAGAVHETRTMSEILGHGRLHEVSGIIDALDADNFSRLPPGQKKLILLKCDDVVNSGEDSLKAAGVSFLETLLRIGIHLPKEDYRRIVAPSINWAYEQEFVGKSGNLRLQNAIEKAAMNARTDALDVISEELLKLTHLVNLESKPNWYLQVLRNLLSTILANQACHSLIDELATELEKINKIQRAR